MAFTEDSLKAKLSSLNETQEAISTVGQWILFHRRHADRIAQVWLERVINSTPSKKLVLVYLANGKSSNAVSDGMILTMGQKSHKHRRCERRKNS
jgi:hypothetical protein